MVLELSVWLLSSLMKEVMKLSICKGKRVKYNNSLCSKTLYRCKKCGNWGCDQTHQGECTNQGFVSGRCLKCLERQKEPIY